MSRTPENDDEPVARPASTETLYQGWTKLVRARFTLPDGRPFVREIEDHGNGVAVLPYDPGRRTAVLVRQFRAPVHLVSGAPDTLEAIAGIVESGSPEECARREALEEAGLRLGPMDKVAATWSMPGLSTERLDLYLAVYGTADRIAAGGGLAEEHEDIAVVELPLVELWQAMQDREAVVDMKTLVLVQALRLRNPGLF